MAGEEGASALDSLELEHPGKKHDPEQLKQYEEERKGQAKGSALLPRCIAVYGWAEERKRFERVAADAGVDLPLHFSAKWFAPGKAK